ncbi:helix-turn-helix transcriptional regulator [Mumia quercus]|uniref:helix-turn-helix transcriptional regulator n=1 Tax=Mumia quercus TaxID=2976125 RepID=UPI0021D34F60|nr:helix-turn-helix transcriptional regulator [Mumia quercus]
MGEHDVTPPLLVGRRRECARLDDLVADARAGRSSAMVLTGEPGIGKTALLEHVANAAGAAEGRVLRAVGAQAENDLPYAGLHQLCHPLLDLRDRLPAPQAQALGVAFGLCSGPAPERLMVGLATLSLLTEAARDQPLVCLVDDADVMDRASAQALSFVAHRLRTQAVVLLVATRPGAGNEWSGLPRTALRGLPRHDAETLLSAVIPSPLDRRVRDRLLSETRGNPSALRTLPRWFSAAEMVLGPQTMTLASPSEQDAALRRLLEPLAESERQLLLAAACDPTGDVALLRRVVERLGLATDLCVETGVTGVLELRDTVRFRPPLMRSVVYRAATAAQRRTVHEALAHATDADQDPHRRVWHQAHAVGAPDEATAVALEEAADRTTECGGPAVAAAFLERAAALTPDVGVRARRQLAAIEALLHVGAVDAARALSRVAEGEVLDEARRARLDLLRARIEAVSGTSTEVSPVLLAVARRLEAWDSQLALDGYADAFAAALFSARTDPTAGLKDVAEAVRGAPVPQDLRRGDRLLHGVATLYTDGYAAAVPVLKGAIEAFDTEDVTLDEAARVLWLVELVAAGLWDDRAWDRSTRRHVALARSAGALGELMTSLHARVFVTLFEGDLEAAAAMTEEIRGLERGPAPTPYGAVGLAAFRGDEDEAERLLASADAQAAARGDGMGAWVAQWARSVLYNGLGRYPEALESTRKAAVHPHGFAVAAWMLVERVEAAARAGERATAERAMAQLSDIARPSGSDWSRGVAARCEAQLRDGERAESLYREAIDRLERTTMRADLGRAQLAYGEWLRRAGRRTEARAMLRAAHELLTTLGLAAFAERARRELAATGETVRKRVDDDRHALTPQELHVARLAAEGLTNPDIGSELFLSPRTVEWHMGKVFGKLGISSRRQLRGALRAGEHEEVPGVDQGRARGRRRERTPMLEVRAVALRGLREGEPS